MIQRWFLTCLTMLYMCPAMGQQLGANFTHRPTVLNEDPAEREIRRLLDRVHTIHFVEVPLSEVVWYFRNEGVPMSVDLRSLEDIGIGQDSQLTFHRRDVRLRDALNLMLRPLDLTWTIQDGSLLIATEEAIDDFQVAKIYNVGSLVGASAEFDSLIDVLTTNIAPRSWDEVGGRGSIQEYETPRMRVLIISQNYRVHEQIESLLNQLSRLGGSTPLRTGFSVTASGRRPLSILPSRNGFQQSPSAIHSSQLRMSGR